jgi:hypothetical protein
MTDIALIDDDGVTAVFAHNLRARNIAAEIGAMSGFDILWCSEPPMPHGVVSVGAVTLCPSHFASFGKQLSDAGLVVIIPDVGNEIKRLRAAAAKED